MPSFLDSLAIFFIIIMGYSGFTKGFIEEFGRLLGLIFAVFVSMSKSVAFSSYLSDIILTLVNLFYSHYPTRYCLFYQYVLEEF